MSLDACSHFSVIFAKEVEGEDGLCQSLEMATAGQMMNQSWLILVGFLGCLWQPCADDTSEIA